jgi:hypothetical protein
MVRLLFTTVLASVCLAVSLKALANTEGPESTTNSCNESSVCKPCDCSLGFDDCRDACTNCDRFLGMLPSDHCFDRFVSPISNPFFFEDPRSLTEVRGIFLDNSLPNGIGGGDAQAEAVQLRGRLTDNLSVIVPRLGYLQVNQSGNGAPQGFMSTPIGFKYNFVRDPDQQLLISGGVTYFIPGSESAFSSFGDGDIHFFLTGGKQIFDWGHWLSATGFRIPLDSNFGTQFWYWSNQWDYELPGHVYPLIGVNWFHWMKSAGNNFTNGGIAGTNVVTGVVGVKWKPNSHVELGSGFEFPLTERTDILQNRVYADLIFRY